MTVLLGFQLIGEVLVRLLWLPVPGPVIGMLLLVGLLLWRGTLADMLRPTTQTLLGHLALLFVPAGVGVMVHFALLQREWLAVLVVLLGSTLLTLLATALTMRVLLRWQA
jgi:holin-like protein